MSCRSMAHGGRITWMPWSPSACGPLGANRSSRQGSKLVRRCWSGYILYIILYIYICTYIITIISMTIIMTIIILLLFFYCDYCVYCNDQWWYYNHGLMSMASRQPPPMATPAHVLRLLPSETPLPRIATSVPRSRETWGKSQEMSGNMGQEMLFDVIWDTCTLKYFGRTNHGRSNMSVLICINLLVIYSRHVARCSAFWTRCVFLQIFMHLGLRMRININPKGSNLWSLWRREKWKNC